MKMKLSKKLMLFEEFTEVKTEVGSTVDTTVDYGMKGEIIQDVDTIISKLEDLANNLGSDRVGTTETANESNEILVEGAADQLMSAELYMLPLVAAGLVGGAAVGVGVLIKRAMKRKKIKKLFSKEIEKPRLEAMKLKIQKAKLEGDAKKKAEDKIKDLESGASTMQSSLGEKYPDSKDLLAALNADLNFKITSTLIKSGALSPSELEKAKQTNANAQETIETATTNATEQKEKGKDLAANATDEEKDKIKNAAEEAKEKMNDNEEDPKVKAVEDKIKEYEDAIEQLSNKKDKKSQNDMGILQAALANKKKELEKLKES
jgi:hypothetical protein